MSSTDPLGSEQQITQDVKLIVSGGFSPDSIGPEKYEAALARVRAAPSAYLDALEKIYMGPNFNAQQQSELYLPDFLEIVAPFEPARVRQILEALLRQFNDVMVIHDQAQDTEALRALLPNDTIDLMQRLEQKRMQLNTLLGA